MEKYQNILDILNFKKVFNTFGGMGQTWKLVNERSFKSTEIAAVRSNTVAEGKYGKTIVIFMKDGGQTYIPLSENSANIPLGSSIDLKTAKLCDYFREGDGHISRIKVGEILDQSYFAPRLIALDTKGSGTSVSHLMEPLPPAQTLHQDRILYLIKRSEGQVMK